MRYKPSLGYNGLTIVMSNQSRFDVKFKKLLSGNAGDWFVHQCLEPAVSRFNCDIRTLDTFKSEPLIRNTRLILALGQNAAQYFTGHSDQTIHQSRGNINFHGDIPVITSYLPQDSFDPVNHESRFNPLLQGLKHEDEEAKDGDTGLADKNKSRTRRKNWRFWLAQDVAKAIRILENKGRIPESNHKFEYVVRPNSEEIIYVLSHSNGEVLTFDMETDFDSNMLCFAFHLSSSDRVYCVPVLNCYYNIVYPNIGAILRALAIAMCRNTVVTHNGYSFDLVVLATKYRFPLGKAQYDTLLAQHRCYPEVERSLGHCISLWTYQQYHKDEIVFMPRTSDQETKNLQYCGKDVSTTLLVKEGIDKHASVQRGLVQSIQQAMLQVRPYIIVSLTGMKFNQLKRQKLMDYNSALMVQYLRLINYLVGYELSPSSPKQCIKYFHEELEYDVVMRTNIGAPSLKGDAIEQLKLRHPENLVLTLCVLYRAARKQCGSLKFKPWKATASTLLDEEAETEVNSEGDE